MNKISFTDYWRMGRARGFTYPFRYFLQSHLFDLRRGTDTQFWVPPIEYSSVCPAQNDAVHYVACPTKAIRRGLLAIRENVGKEFDQYQFFDLGCGKGKALLLYSESASPQKLKAVGVELVPSLADIAWENVKRMGFSDWVEVVSADAVQWVQYCDSDQVIVFLYNPFGLTTLERVFADVQKFRNAYVIYVDPEHASFFEHTGWKRVYTGTGRYRNDFIDVWAR